MIILPTTKYIRYIRESKHYLNSPKHMLNEAINHLCRGYSKEVAIINLRNFFANTGHRFSDKRIGEIVDFHHSITMEQLHELCPNEFPTDSFIERRNKEIDSYIKNHTRWMFGIQMNQPSFPFRKSL